MIGIEVVAQIRRLFFVEHMTINAISSQLSLHRDTVRRALSTETFRNRRYHANILEPWRNYILETLDIYPRIKAPRLTMLLRDRGYRGSESSVRAYLRNFRKQNQKAFLRLEYFPGEQAQVDWADFGKVNVDGGSRRLSCFVMVMAYSRYLFARFGYDQSLESFLSGHVEAFGYFKGVPRSLLYDNLKSAVIERLDGHIRFNSNLLELSAYYHFAAKACQPYAGNQKGRVERAIRYIRENFFEARSYTDLEDLNKQLDACRDDVANVRAWPQNRERTVEQAFEEERGVLIPTPERSPDVSRMQVVRSGKTPYVYFDGNHYSIPHEFVSIPLTLRILPDAVEIYGSDELLAGHRRSFGKGLYIENPDHIRALVEHKKVHKSYKGRSLLLSTLPEASALIPLWLERSENMSQSAKRLLELLEVYTKADVIAAIDQAMANGTPAVDSILYILTQNQKPSLPSRRQIHLSERLQNMEIRSHDPSQYDDLLEKKEPHDPGTQTRT